MTKAENFEASHTPFSPEKYGRSPYEIKRAEILQNMLPPSDGARAIDVGCGPGFFSKQLTKRGWLTTSVDTDASNLEYAKPFVEQTFCGDALAVLPQLPQETYSLALALEIIEHMPEERGNTLLAEIRRVLQRGARLIISTPNRHSPEGLGGYYWGEKMRGGERWDAWDPTHVRIYSARELIRLLRENGFSIDRVTGYHYYGRIPILGRWKLPIDSTNRGPFNLFGFNVIIEARRV